MAVLTKTLRRTSLIMKWQVAELIAWALAKEANLNSR